MGLFDIFKKKKKTESAFPENELEKALMKASSDWSARKGFYMKLLWNELYVLTSENSSREEGAKVLEKGTMVDIVSFETGEIPVFTSTNRIFDKGVIKTEVPFIAMKGQDLFRVTKGATLILNPYSPYGKELLPNEIESLLNGSIFEQEHGHQIEEDTPVRIGQPKIYPQELVKELNKLFKKHPEVKDAYLAMIEMKPETEPHLIIALDMDGDLRSVTNYAGPLAEKVLNNQMIDFIQIDDKGGISDYFLKETQPFYRR